MKQLETKNIALGICKNCKCCKSNKKCVYMRKHGHYTTKANEKIQRYLCIKTYTTFSKYTNDSALSYMRNRKLPIAKIVESYKSVYSTLKSMAFDYNLTVSTIRTVLKRSAINFKILKEKSSYCLRHRIYCEKKPASNTILVWK